MPQVRVNIRSVANTKSVRREKRNGRDVVIVPSATLPDDIVMNGIKYPADEIAKSFKSLERTPAPLGHPMVNGKFVSAKEPEGIVAGWIGAWNENVRRENGRVFLDKVIDVANASLSEGGKAVLEAIDKGEPIHTSTGLLTVLEAVNGAADHKHIARQIRFDHDAILLNEEGAATPDDGVGMLVNAQGEQEEIQVINSAVTEADRDIDWAMDSLARALEKRQRAGILDIIKGKLLEAMGVSDKEPATNRKDIEMTVTKEQFDALDAKVNALADALKPEGLGKSISEAVANAVKPLVDAQAELKANQEAKDAAELASLVDDIVKANLLDEATAKELTLNAARKLAEKAKPGKATGLNGASALTNAADEFAGVDLNAAMEAK